MQQAQSLPQRHCVIKKLYPENDSLVPVLEIVPENRMVS